MQAFLKKHGPGAAIHSLKVSWIRTGSILEIDFLVQKRSSTPWLAETSFTDDWNKNWGLWNTDVVEAFLQLRKSADDVRAPYLEIQVSPLNQPFALVIVEPRLQFHPPVNLIFETTSHTEGRSWSAHMKVTLPDDLQGELLYGGFFSCLSENPREFFALEPNPEAAPDFHRPELFLPLEQD